MFSQIGKLLRNINCMTLAKCIRQITTTQNQNQSTNLNGRLVLFMWIISNRIIFVPYPSNLPRPDIKTNLLCRAKEISHLSVSHGINRVPGVLENSFVRYISVSSPFACAVEMMEYRIALHLAPLDVLLKSQFFLPTVNGRIAFSASYPSIRITGMPQSVS